MLKSWFYGIATFLVITSVTAKVYKFEMLLVQIKNCVLNNLNEIQFVKRKRFAIYKR